MFAALQRLARRFWVPALALLLTWAASLAPIHARLEWWALDFQQRLAAEEHYFRDVVVLEIDEPSIKALQPYFGTWPFRRDAYALLLDYLGDMGAKTVAFDILFAEPREGDDAFQRALQRNGNAVLAASALNRPGATRPRQMAREGNTPPPALHWPALALPLPRFANASRVGMISVEADADGVLRRVPLAHESGGTYLPSLALAALSPSRESQELRHLAETGELRAGGRAWPVDGSGSARLIFPRNANPVPTMSLARVAKAALGMPSFEIENDFFMGKTVFIGNTALFSDRVNTPRGIMNGIHVLAIAHQALAHDLVLRPANWRWNTLLMLAALLPSFLSRRSAWGIAMSGAGAALAVIALNLFLFRTLHQEGTFVPPLLAAFFSSMLAIGSALREEASRRAQAAISRAEAATELALGQQRAVAMVSHELRTPLSIIDASLQSLKRLSRDAPAEILSRHDKIQRASLRLQALVNNHLTGERLLHAGQPPRMAPVDVHELLARAAPREQWPNLELQAEGLRVTVRGDFELLRIAFANLVDNAVKYSPAGSPVRIEGEATGNTVEVRITDAGIGISPENLPHVFDQYFRVEGTERRGSGLGLYLVRQIIELHDGTISARSTIGRGTEMRVKLPLDTP